MSRAPLIRWVFFIFHLVLAGKRFTEDVNKASQRFAFQRTPIKVSAGLFRLCVSPNNLQVLQLKQLVGRVKTDYTATAIGIHSSARLQLTEAQRAYEEALAAAQTKRVGRCGGSVVFAD